MENQLDEKAIADRYIASYHYTTTQRIVAIIAIIAVLCGIVCAGTYLFMSIINLIKP